MASRTDAYVDTSALIAFADRSDSHHSLFRRLFSDPPPLVSTTLVVAEGHGWFLRRYDRTRALQFLAMIDLMSPLEVIAVSSGDLEMGARFLRQFQGQNLTLTDAVGLQLLEAREIGSCWSTDFHLGLTGVPLVIHTH